MSKTEIRVGQEWTEKSYGKRVMRVAHLVMRQRDGKETEEVFAVAMVLVSGTGRPTTKLQAYVLRNGWTLTKEASDAPPRRIALPLAPDTTATECGGCPRLRETEDDAWFCRAFSGHIPMNTQTAQRLPECIAAEAS